MCSGFPAPIDNGFFEKTLLKFARRASAYDAVTELTKIVSQPNFLCDATIIIPALISASTMRLKTMMKGC